MASSENARPRSEARVEPAAAAALVEDLDGARHRLDSLWRRGPVVLVLLRHFG